MALFLGSFLLLVGAGLWLSFFSGRYERFREDAGIHIWLSMGFVIVLGIWAWSAHELGQMAQLAVTVLGIVLGVCWAPYLSGLIAHRLTKVLAVWSSDNNITMPVSFDKGDAALKGGDPLRALALFKQELDRHPDHPDLFLRMAEAQKALGNAGQVTSCMQEAARCAADPHRKGPLLLQLSEHLGVGGDVAEARRVLEGVLGDPALVPYHAPARSRLAALERPR